MRLCVFGANGATGRTLTQQALDEGHDVTAFTRHPAAFPIRHEALRVDAGDVADADAVEKAVAGRDVVLSSLGVPFGRRPVSVYSVGTATILAAMGRVGVDRFVGVTSSAVEPHPEPVGGFWFAKVVQPLVVNVLGRTSYDDMRRMEAVVRASALDWVIVRPSGLFSGVGVSAYEVTEGHGAGRFTSRADLADCLLREAGPGGHHQKVVAVVTRAHAPSILQLIWREGIKKKG